MIEYERDSQTERQEETYQTRDRWRKSKMDED